MLIILLACPPWMHTLPKWAQICVAIVGGPVAWICIAFFAYWVISDDGTTSERSALRSVSGSR